jgi:hypothetical protein
MKNVLFAALILIVAPELKSQEKLSFKRSTDSSLSYLLNNVRLYKRFETKDLAITLYLVSNPATSQNSEGSDEVSDNLYLGVSEFDEYPKRSLFILKDVFGAIDFKIGNKNNNAVSIEFSYFDRKVKLRKKCSGIIAIDKVVLNL